MNPCEHIGLETGRVCGRPAGEWAVIFGGRGWLTLCLDRHANTPCVVLERIFKEKLLLRERARNAEAALGRITRIVEVDYRRGNTPVQWMFRLIYDERFWGDFHDHSPVLVSVRGIN